MDADKVVTELSLFTPADIEFLFHEVSLYAFEKATSYLFLFLNKILTTMNRAFITTIIVGKNVRFEVLKYLNQLEQ